MAAYTDVNVPWTSDKDDLFSRLHTAVQLGYHSFVLNNSVDDALQNKKNAKDKRSQVAPASDLVIPQKELAKLEQKCNHDITIYKRFSTVVDDPGQTHKIQSDRNIQSYDIIAVAPTSDKTFQFACLNLDVDIITLDFTQRLSFHFKKTHINVAIERGLHFEILYSPAIRNTHARRYTISNALALINICKGKNVILSGGCEKPIEFRSPYDVMNLGILFGLSDAQCRQALSLNIRSLFLHAKARKTTGAAVKLTQIENISEDEAWKVRETNISKVKTGMKEEVPDEDGESDDSHNKSDESDNESDDPDGESDDESIPEDQKTDIKREILSDDGDTGEPSTKKQKT